MDARLVRRPVIDLLLGRGQCLISLNASSQRHQSSFRRTKQHLNIKPDSSFLISNESPKQDHIIFNPPSASPSVLHTPLKFLPKEDKRRQLLAATAEKLNPAPARLPPPVSRRPKIPHHHLSDADIAEIQRLKRDEPEKWNNLKLSRKFNCSSMFISICLSQCGYDDTVTREAEKARLAGMMDSWGPRRRKAHEDKLKRMEIALRDE
ncbi:54S ribosomal protein L20, mitochondrial [Lachnellula subtilissima]|uniref:54S ribosomal protein L20, mitochondrial n=1 Tax=Lachnellula subtilissima TaxID=602034 RepID=A0A8H8RDD3_9HELO|nr:54S ribosomal protein L20, mitochondrial [Lachnellula subtilissima]